MNDRELLKLAAKAAGLKSGEIENNSANSHQTFYVWNDDDKTSRFWNPLADDGDALRLAVRLNIDFKAYGTVVRTWVGDFTTQKVIASVEEICGVDPYAATRRAITRAAAEIGKEMRCTS